MPHFTKSRITGEKLLGSPLKLIGAKTKVRDVLYPLFPEHKTYIEPFLGSGAVLMGKPKSEIEIVSDINPYVINFFKELQSSSNSVLISDLRFETVWLDNSPLEVFAKWKRRATDPSRTDRERAFLFYLITKHCMNGIWRLNKKGECNSSYCGTTKGRGILTQPWLEDIVDRIKDVQFKHGDYGQTFANLLNEDINPDTFIFLDPPYADCKTTYNGIRWAHEDFEHLRNWLKGDMDRCKFLMTINDNEFIRDLFKDYEIVEHKVNYSCSQTVAGRGKKPELLVANYPIAQRYSQLFKDDCNANCR